jgi:hypothetical protein
VLAAVVGAAAVEAVEVVGFAAGGLGETVVGATVGVEVVGEVLGFDPARQPLPSRIPTAPRATRLRLTGINPQPRTTTHAKMGIYAFCE